MCGIKLSGGENKQLTELIAQVSENSGIAIKDSIFISDSKSAPLPEDCDLYVLPYGTAPPERGRAISYSLSDNRADAVLINIQNHPDCKSFEIMTDSSMGRVFINNKNKIPVEAVLICAAVFLGLGDDLSHILEALNGILK